MGASSNTCGAFLRSWRIVNDDQVSTVYRFLSHLRRVRQHGVPMASGSPRPHTLGSHNGLRGVCAQAATYEPKDRAHQTRFEH